MSHLHRQRADKSGLGTQRAEAGSPTGSWADSTCAFSSQKEGSDQQLKRVSKLLFACTLRWKPVLQIMESVKLLCPWLAFSSDF